MRSLIFISSIVWSFTVAGQSNTSNLKQKGNSLKDLYPPAWKLLDSTYGDLNKDGIEDLAFVIQDTDTAKIEKNSKTPESFTDLNPRVLGIYFGSSSGNFNRKLQSDSFILLKDSPTMEEPFDGVKITEGGILQIDFHLWFSAGSWTMSSHTYKFRFQNDQFELIGYDSEEAHRGTGETIDYSINFPTRKMKITKGHFSKDKPVSIKWKKFELKKLESIKSLGKPFSWKFEGIYL